MKRLVPSILFFAVLLLGAAESAESRLNRAALEAQHDLDASRRAILSEKRALADRADAVQNQLSALKATEAGLQQEDNALRSRLETARRERAKIERTKLQIERIMEELNLLALTANTPGAPATPADRLSGVSAALAKRRGGTEGTMQVLLPDGTLTEASSLRVGPLLFAEAAGRRAPAYLQEGSPYPRLFPVKASEERMIARLLQGDSARVPLDVTGGSAFQLADRRDSLLHHLLMGGPTMIPILLLGILCLAIFLARLPALLRLPGASAPELVRRTAALLKQGDSEGAAQTASTAPEPIRDLLEAAIAKFSLEKDALEEHLYAATLTIMPKYERHIGLLAISASTTPLLGLLGTVTGMIHTFRLITVFGTGDASLLSDGISEALITTEAGLVVAIPAMMMHAWCRQRTRRLATILKEAAVIILNAKEDS